MFFDRDPYGYTRRVKEAIPERLYPDNINKDSGIEFYTCGCPRANNIIPTWCQSRPPSSLNDKDINTAIMQQHSRQDRIVPIIANHGATNTETYIASVHNRLMKTSNIAVVTSRPMHYPIVTQLLTQLSIRIGNEQYLSRYCFNNVQNSKERFSAAQQNALKHLVST